MTVLIFFPDPISKRWSFPITSHDTVVNKLQGVATVSQLPKIIVCALKESYKSLDNIDISRIDNVLLSSLLPFQEEGIRCVLFTSNIKHKLLNCIQ